LAFLTATALAGFAAFVLSGVNSFSSCVMAPPVVAMGVI
jgi:hypothetical protein